MNGEVLSAAQVASPRSRTAFDRGQALARLASEEFDVLVVGGGVTGAGVALDAAARGLRTALVERADFASGTSSRSSKLVHGGLRYLQQKEYLLVRENIVERQRLLANAPHLVRPLPFLVPVVGRPGPPTRAVARAYSAALWLYDLAGGVLAGNRHRRIPLDEVQAHMPTLRPDAVAAGFVYYDAQADDARLTLAVARTAALDHGAVVANYAPVTALAPGDGGRLRGALVRPDPGASETVDDERGGAGAMLVRTAAVVNATGVWADQVRGLAAGPGDGKGPGRWLRPAKGIHLTVSRERLPCDVAAVLPVAADRRSIFVVPWGARVYLGTTDTDYQGPLDDPQCTPQDVAYVLGAVNAFLTHPLTPADVVGSWAGLRPLVRGAGSERTADLSRRHQVDVGPDGLVTVTGGKLTTYRRMAADAVDQVVRLLGRGQRRSPTPKLALRGAEGTPALLANGAARRLGVAPDLLAHLVSRHGSEALAVLALVRADPDQGRPLVPGLPYLRAEAVYAARHEMAHTLDDVLSRRTRALVLARDASAAAAPEVAALLAPELGWSPSEVQRQVARYLAAVDHERTSAGLPVAGVGA